MSYICTNGSVLVDPNLDPLNFKNGKIVPKLCILSNYRYGHDKVAKLLIERGASVTQINSNGYNPLVVAILYGKRYDSFNRQSQGNVSMGNWQENPLKVRFSRKNIGTYYISIAQKMCFVLS